jgi:hypothetical protein
MLFFLKEFEWFGCLHECAKASTQGTLQYMESDITQRVQQTRAKSHIPVFLKWFPCGVWCSVEINIHLFQIRTYNFKDNETGDSGKYLVILIGHLILK